MGGKLFDLPRMPRAEYLERERAIRAHLDRALDGAYRIPRYYDHKPDFGDMDVIVPTRPDWGEVRAAIARDLGVTQVKAVGHVFSMAFRGLQTDLFAVPARYLDSMCTFMSFNDVGNLLGRMVRRFGLKYGEQGLSYVYRRAGDEHYRADLPVTQDFARICGFLGLDHDRWLAGFADLDAIFTWATASPYFSVAPYLDDLTGEMAQRSRHRPTIVRFLDWLRERGLTQRPAFADKASYLPMIAAAFPEAELERQIEVERAKEARGVALRQKWSGQLVMRLRPELRGEALGAFIQAFRASVADFEAYILAADPDELAARIRAFVPPAAP